MPFKFDMIYITSYVGFGGLLYFHLLHVALASGQVF